MSETRHEDGNERDAGLAALYRAAAREEPPAALDDAIRAAARRAVSSRPRSVNSPFLHAWRVPLSVAAVVLLSVSLVTVMREEAPEIVAPTGGVPATGVTDTIGARSAADAVERAAAVPGSPVPGTPRSENLGLKPPAQTGASGLGLRESRVATDAAPAARRDTAAASRLEADRQPTTEFAKRAAPEAFPAAAGMRDDKTAAPAEKQRQLAKEEALQRPAREAETRSSLPGSATAAATVSGAGATAEGEVKPNLDALQGDATRRARAMAVPAAPPVASPPAPGATGMSQSRTDWPPEQWLARIEELRVQGRLEEAKTSLAEFRKRYPDYVLPATLKAWAGQ